MAQSSYEVSPPPKGKSDSGHPYDDGDRDPPLMPDDPNIPPDKATPPPRGGDDDDQ
jgi:hypothetical protein